MGGWQAGTAAEKQWNQRKLPKLFTARYTHASETPIQEPAANISASIQHSASGHSTLEELSGHAFVSPKLVL